MHIQFSTFFMKPFLYVSFLMISVGIYGQSPAEIARWKQQAQHITVLRDTWGIAHIYGKTDADAVFGMLYTQCEDDFARVEANYLTAIGRMAEVEGEKALYQDLRARLFIDSTQAIAYYKKSPDWMKKLLHAFADGVNYYLYKHPEVKPKVLRRFQPWMPLMFSEGSIGGNVSAVSAERLRAFYENKKYMASVFDFEKYENDPVGSNGIAIAPAKSATKNALLLINPHTSFYFRSELQITSQEGLNAYGAVTWGQFFIYQGFNENCGWMHTSSSADSMDEYLETIFKKNGKRYYQYGKQSRPVTTKKIVLRYREGDKLLSREFTGFYTHHGPVVGEKNGQWLTVRMMNDPINALAQSYLRTKASDYESYKKAMKLNGNATNNTIFADRKGNIAYWHGNFMPKRDTTFDWSQPVEGSNPATDWKGLHSVDEIVQSLNPAEGWIQNCNATPFTVAGQSSPIESRYPRYMAPDAENYRGINAVRVLSKKPVFTLDTLIEVARDPYLAGFEKLIPSLIADFEQIKPSASVAQKEAIEVLKTWDFRCGVGSVPTTLAIYWGEKIQRLARTKVAPNQKLDFLRFTDFIIAQTTPQEKVNLLQETLDELTRDFGQWQTPWGEINRYQRLTGNIEEVYDDTKPSLPVAFTPSTWGSLSAYGARKQANTKKRYGYVGNSFVAVVEFGPRVKARSVTTGGASSKPSSVHFNDQAAIHTVSQFKEVWFYREEVEQHLEKKYQL